ncbi:dTDP-glucose 4,6-dehydratase [Candidatus Persebacteraceae bacterium Df01]|jgi:dTDP-glucose 4,6-dehydratase|uniref:dTDP-glucose 4,6-dehydratase n=1 Tax=Candidatus Doriopsillibacter californiensis TaxID=2970740 RepID=A0ABT7QMZ7_9GAMM|nr:dTDP-glucose 4,6-dehydratase [Candidatus Persebacteraceae bacterium Df01]
MSTILVTGGCGFIGTNFIRHWLNNHSEDRVINFDSLTYAGNLENLSDVADNPRYTFIHADIADMNSVITTLEKHKPDVIVNFAAESHNSRAIVDPGSFFRTNVLGTQTLLEAARQAKTPRFHHISTCEVFGDLALDSTDKFQEDYPYRPRTPYNASKAGADHAVRAYVETFKLPATISICANNYGPYQFPEKLIPHFCTRLMRGEKMPLYKSSCNRREWLHVLDHCRAVEKIITAGQIGETYNIGSETEMDIEEVADRLLTAFGFDDSYKEYVPDRPGHDRRYLLDNIKICRELGWEATIGLDEGFADTVAWYRSNEQWWAPLLEKMVVNESNWK